MGSLYLIRTRKDDFQLIVSWKTLKFLMIFYPSCFPTWKMKFSIMSIWWNCLIRLSKSQTLKWRFSCSEISISPGHTPGQWALSKIWRSGGKKIITCFPLLWEKSWKWFWWFWEFRNRNFQSQFKISFWNTLSIGTHDLFWFSLRKNKECKIEFWNLFTPVRKIPMTILFRISLRKDSLSFSFVKFQLYQQIVENCS